MPIEKKTLDIDDFEDTDDSDERGSSESSYYDDTVCEDLILKIKAEGEHLLIKDLINERDACYDDLIDPNLYKAVNKNKRYLKQYIENIDERTTANRFVYVVYIAETKDYMFQNIFNTETGEQICYMKVYMYMNIQIL